MGRPSNKKAIEERREKILLLLSRGYSQYQITKELNTTRQTISKDMKAINTMTNKGLFGLAKETLSTMYFSCIQGVEQVQKEAWKIYKNENNDHTITNWHKMAALKLCKDASESKFTMFANAPVMMMESEVIELKNGILEDKEPRGFRRLPFHNSDRDRDTTTTSSSTSSTSSSNDLDKP
jgi:transcriptional regulator